MEIRAYNWTCLWTNKMKRILFVLCSLLPSLLLADNVTVEQAQSLAVNFFKTSAQTRSTSPQIQLVWNGEEVVHELPENLLFMYLTVPIRKVLLSYPVKMSLYLYWRILSRIDSRRKRCLSI
jgi:hypothetical protein